MFCIHLNMESKSSWAPSKSYQAPIVVAAHWHDLSKITPYTALLSLDCAEKKKKKDCWIWIDNKNNNRSVYKLVNKICHYLCN